MIDENEWERERVRERKDDIDIVVIMDYNPGSLFSIQKSEIEEFVIPGSGRDWRLTDIIISTCTEKKLSFFIAEPSPQ